MSRFLTTSPVAFRPVLPPIHPLTAALLHWQVVSRTGLIPKHDETHLQLVYMYMYQQTTTTNKTKRLTSTTVPLAIHTSTECSLNQTDAVRTSTSTHPADMNWYWYRHKYWYLLFQAGWQRSDARLLVPVLTVQTVLPYNRHKTHR